MICRLLAAALLVSGAAAVPLRFFVTSDNHVDPPAHIQLVSRMMAQYPPPALVLNAGDLTDHGTDDEYRRFFAVESALLAVAPLYPALGNHCAENMANWRRYFGNDLWYTVRMENCAFHALDFYSDHGPGSAQYDWLVAELLADSSSGVEHIFLYQHIPIYPSDQGDGDPVALEHLVPLFERFGVEIVFGGHSHAYDHSAVNGVHYIVTGGGGGNLNRYWRDPEPWWLIYHETTYEFVLVDVRGDTVVSRGIRPDGTEFDSLVLVNGLGACTETGRIPRHGWSATTGCGRINFLTARPGRVRVTLFDAGGRMAARLIDGYVDEGRHQLDLAGRGLPAGAYCCRFEIEGETQTARLILFR